MHSPNNLPRMIHSPQAPSPLTRMTPRIAPKSPQPFSPSSSTRIIPPYNSPQPPIQYSSPRIPSTASTSMLHVFNTPQQVTRAPSVDVARQTPQKCSTDIFKPQYSSAETVAMIDKLTQLIKNRSTLK
eukprot:gnl/MRDRNA2_/MRDRNA2_196489_c0_seq1.p1 gnl/MRDRNA2_/MRDRNA2_196489_c0~~gnl/MRDRNA2_/MRDRNA2_196489_c0_seq1.p1  ORF type:complete len:128 (-),score=2.39 gnl/MRDRNA2_/MRDRNA2_196489_c0_seq1:199-582(-)